MSRVIELAASQFIPNHLAQSLAPTIIKFAKTFVKDVLLGNFMDTVQKVPSQSRFTIPIGKVMTTSFRAVRLLSNCECYRSLMLSFSLARSATARNQKYTTTAMGTLCNQRSAQLWTKKNYLRGLTLIYYCITQICIYFPFLLSNMHAYQC